MGTYVSGFFVLRNPKNIDPRAKRKSIFTIQFYCKYTKLSIKSDKNRIDDFLSIQFSRIMKHCLKDAENPLKKDKKEKKQENK